MCGEMQNQKIWRYPSKGLASHNIKALSFFGRYAVGLYIFYLTINNLSLPHLVNVWNFNLFLLGIWKSG